MDKISEISELVEINMSSKSDGIYMHFKTRPKNSERI